MLSKNKKGQVTIFIIVGVVILAVFSLMIYLSSNIQKEQFKQEAESILKKQFDKEAIRIYVEDCLQDHLEKGLILLGKQGTLWADQPGGINQFIENETGIYYHGERVYYAITESKLGAAYPCNNLENEPNYCNYKYPNTSIGFGDLNIKYGSVGTELKNYLISMTQECVNDYTKKEFSGQELIKAEEMKADLKIFSDGILILVDYPLTVKISDREHTHEFTFDFFYETKLEKLLKSAVEKPIYNEWKYVDFNFTDEQLKQSKFVYASPIDRGSCLLDQFWWCNSLLPNTDYQNLAITLEKEILNNGDVVYEFNSSFIIPERYIFRFAIQNRPPALNYIERRSCPSEGYDYLVINNHNEFGYVNITPIAHDPEDNNFNFYLENNEIKNKFILNPFTENLTFVVKDEYNASDNQTVRIKVLPEINLTINFYGPYKFKIDNKLINYSDLGYNLVSLEDPFFVNISVPDYKLSKLMINYTHDLEQFGFETTKECNPIPFTGSCNLQDNYDFNQEISFKELGLGKLKLTFETLICQESFKDENEIDLIVQQCVPHLNPEHPFSYPYNNYKYGLNEEGWTNFSNYLGQEEINKHLATHSCCGSLGLKSENDLCFINPEYGCYNGTEQGQENPGIYLEEETRFCDGINGNQCLGEKKYNLINNYLICGGKSYSGCKPSECEGKIAGRITGSTWCYGVTGCEKACKTAVVGLIDNLAEAHCGCQPEDDDKKCYNLNKELYGQCEGGVCRTN
jgi:hypothetical protein